MSATEADDPPTAAWLIVEMLKAGAELKEVLPWLVEESVDTRTRLAAAVAVREMLDNGTLNTRGLQEERIRALIVDLLREQLLKHHAPAQSEPAAGVDPCAERYKEFAHDTDPSFWDSSCDESS